MSRATRTDTPLLASGSSTPLPAGRPNSRHRYPLGLRAFLGYELQQSPPDHSTISRTRRRIGIEAHKQVFERLREAGLANGGRWRWTRRCCS